VSPHLDDAALSCGGRLDGRSVVVTVFSGVPPQGTPTPDWDRLTGADDSHQRCLDRLEEDAKALTGLGCETVRLGLLDAQYRDAPTDLAMTTALLVDLFAEAAEVWLPAAIGSHPDHLAARDAGLAALVGKDTSTYLYADIPYAVLGGWPAWVTGDEPHEPGPAGWLDARLEEAGLDRAALTPWAYRLDPEQTSRKRRAIETYVTQVSVLDQQCGGRLRDDVTIGFELSWALSRRSTSSTG
jgi:LmbE family N-acetylglucosaminyl deacetylase